MGDNSQAARKQVDGIGLSRQVRSCDLNGDSQRVGVLTFHRCFNYGSYWQTRCLVDALRSKGHEVTVLDHRSPAASVAEMRCALQPTLPIRSSKLDQEQYACKARSFGTEIQMLPLSKPFDLDHPEQLEELDLIVVGSDEVWNLRHPWYAARPAFFGQGLRAKRVVAYGASFGNYSCWEGIGSPWTDFLQRFDSLSVRDENSWWMLKNCMGKEFDIVLDPCLLHPPSPSGTWKGPSFPFAVVYGHGFSPEFATQVRRWADARGLPLVSLGYRNDWADIQWLTAAPQDFAHSMAASEAIATNFFHGCVFALLNEKPFACESSSYRSIKLHGLMELVGGQGHIVEADHPLGDLLCESIEPSILERIRELRQPSNRYLDGALKSCARA